MAKKITEFDALVELVAKNLMKAIRYLEEEKGVPVYWKLDDNGNITMITIDPEVAKQKGCIKATLS